MAWFSSLLPWTLRKAPTLAENGTRKPEVDKQVLNAWLNHLQPSCSPDLQRPLHPVIQDFKEVIEQDAELFMGFNRMFDEIPDEYMKEPSNVLPQVRDYMTMLTLFNAILTTAPYFEEDDWVALPINRMLNWPMATPAGLALFTNSKVNAQLKRMFDVWQTFLVSPDSRYVLTTAENGWFGPTARKAMPNFISDFVCNPEEDHWGFQSWDDFFSRRVRPEARPLPPSDDPTTIASACESRVYRIAHDIQAQDRFWLKGSPYSVDHMLNHHPLSSLFNGGTIYQAYLSAMDYHRWHSPVSGTIVHAQVVPGTYYSQSPAHGFPDPDRMAACKSQGYLTAVATRAVILIEADSGTGVGLMAFIAVGMAEVSSCEIRVKEGQKVRQGEELGTFRYGGSSHCLIFRKEADVRFEEGCEVGKKFLVNSKIAAAGR